jgi:hypothetical protein
MAPRKRPESDLRLASISEVFARILQLKDLEGGSNHPPHKGGSDDVPKSIANMLGRVEGALLTTTEFEGAGLGGYEEASWPPGPGGGAGLTESAGPRSEFGAEQPQTIRSLKQARNHPDWEGPGGFK